jgi:hypothetical protein
MFADIGNLIGLLIFAVIAILSAVLKKKEKDEEETFELPPELKPRRDQNEPPKRSWEEELRKLLEDRLPPTPVVRPTPPIHRPFAPPVIEPTWAEPQSETHLPAEPPPMEPAFAGPAGFCPPDARFSDAAHLQERVALHMADVTQHRVGSTSVQRVKVSPEILEVSEMVRSRRGARAAIIASIILGPPRALEGWNNAGR